MILSQTKHTPPFPHARLMKEAYGTDTTKPTAATQPNGKNNSIHPNAYNAHRLTFSIFPPVLFKDQRLLTDIDPKSLVCQFSKNQKVRTETILQLGGLRVLKTIGSGSTSQVKLAVHTRTKKKYALKIVKRLDTDPCRKESKEASEARIFREAAMLSIISHPNIVSSNGLLYCADFFCLVSEYVAGREVLDFAISKGPLSEPIARRIFRQLVSAVDYIHNRNIVHRDLKIENVLIDKNGDIKLIDFGLANFYRKDDVLSTFCGSLYFAAPELLHGRRYVGPEVDVWSLGIILYILLVGHVPFDDKSISKLHDKIKAARYTTPPQVSFEAKFLLSRLIVREPVHRASVIEIMASPWINIGHAERLASDRLVTYPLTCINERVCAFLEKAFSAQFGCVRGVLEEAQKYWEVYAAHPVVVFYHLCINKLRAEAEDAGPRHLMSAPPPTYVAEPCGYKAAAAKSYRLSDSTTLKPRISDFLNLQLSPSKSGERSSARENGKAVQRKSGAEKGVYTRNLVYDDTVFIPKISNFGFRTIFQPTSIAFSSPIMLVNALYYVLNSLLIEYEVSIDKVVLHKGVGGGRVVVEIRFVRSLLSSSIMLRFGRMSGSDRAYRRLVADINRYIQAYKSRLKMEHSL